MTKTLSITEARQQLMELATNLEKDPGIVEVTRRGKSVMVIMPIAQYEAIRETLEISADPALLSSIERGLADARKGRVRSLKSVRKQLAV